MYRKEQRPVYRCSCAGRIREVPNPLAVQYITYEPLQLTTGIVLKYQQFAKILLLPGYLAERVSWHGPLLPIQHNLGRGSNERIQIRLTGSAEGEISNGQNQPSPV